MENRTAFKFELGSKVRVKVNTGDSCRNQYVTGVIMGRMWVQRIPYQSDLQISVFQYEVYDEGNHILHTGCSEDDISSILPSPSSFKFELGELVGYQTILGGCQVAEVIGREQYLDRGYVVNKYTLQSIGRVDGFSSYESNLFKITTS